MAAGNEKLQFHDISSCGFLRSAMKDLPERTSLNGMPGTADISFLYNEV